MCFRHYHSDNIRFDPISPEKSGLILFVCPMQSVLIGRRPALLMVCLKMSPVLPSYYYQKPKPGYHQEKGNPYAKADPALTGLEVKKAKPKDKDYKLSDGLGLYLLVTPTGGKLWRMQYRFAAKQKLLAFGSYPAISLAGARERREDARKLIANGFDPSANHKAEKSAKQELLANSFEVVAREWQEKQKDDNAWSEDHAITIMNRPEKDMFPWVGSKPITGVTAKDVRAILDRVQSRGVIETARRCRTIAGQVFTQAISTDRAMYDVAASLKKYLHATGKTRKHMSSVTDPKELAPLLRAIDTYQGGFVAQCALKLLPFVFVRPGELRHMEWVEIDLETAEWNISGPKMKMKQLHLVPLSRQVIEILTEIKPLTGRSKYVFPSTRPIPVACRITPSTPHFVPWALMVRLSPAMDSGQLPGPFWMRSLASASTSSSSSLLMR